MTPPYNRTCAYPECHEKCCTRQSKYCKKHRGMQPDRSAEASKRRAAARLEMHKKNDCTYHGKQSICERCSCLKMCRIEIERPTFWPPCTPASRFYDPNLTGRLELPSVKEQTTEARGTRILFIVIWLVFLLLLFWRERVGAAVLRCYAYKLTNNGWELKPAYCWSNEFRAGKVEPLPPATETEYPWPTATLDKWQPWATATPTVGWTPSTPTPGVYPPPEETGEPYP